MASTALRLGAAALPLATKAAIDSQGIGLAQRFDSYGKYKAFTIGVPLLSLGLSALAARYANKLDEEAAELEQMVELTFQDPNTGEIYNDFVTVREARELQGM